MRDREGGKGRHSGKRVREKASEGESREMRVEGGGDDENGENIERSWTGGGKGSGSGRKG